MAAHGRDAALIVETAGAALGAAIGHLILLLDPIAVVIGGGMADAPLGYWTPAWGSLSVTVQGRRSEPIRVYKASTGKAVGVLGAACAVFAKSGQQPPPASLSPDPWVVV